MGQLAIVATKFLAGSLVSAGVGTIAAIQIATIAVNLGVSLLLSTIANALLAPKIPGPTELSRELARPSNNPPYRFVYGETRAQGSPAGLPIRGEYIYGCWIVNSRPSEGPFTVYLDKRECLATGDPYDFTGGGATATEDPFLGNFTYWISKGDKTSPPDVFLSEAAHGSGEDDELWKSTDGWEGLTVIWAKIKAGPNGSRQERWPSSPPNIELQGKFSKVWDLRDAAQDPDDETTWEYSDNWALCIMDALRNNPVKVYQNKNLDLDIIENSADVSDTVEDLKSGGTEKKYRIAGTLAFTSVEIEDLISPLVLSGGGALTRIGGKLGILAAEYQTPVATINTIFGESFKAVDLKAGEDISNELRVTYLSADRGYESAELQPYPIPGALAEDGGVADVQNLDLNFCPSPTQAMRVRKIFGGLIRRQKILDVVLPPEAFNCVVGSTINLDLEAPFDIFNGVYEVLAINPGFDMVGENGLSMLLPATLIKHSEDIYDWVPAVDEEDIVQVIYTEDRDAVNPPGTLAATLDYFNSGGTFIPRIRFNFDPSVSTGVEYYDWQYSKNGDPYQDGGSISKDILDGSGKVFGYLFAEENSEYDIRVRTVTPVGQSAYVTISGIQTDMTITSIVDSGGVGEYTFDGVTPVSPNFSYMKIYSNSVDTYGTATLEETITGIASNTAFSETFSKAAGTEFYWIVPYSTNDTEGTVSGSYEIEVT